VPFAVPFFWTAHRMPFAFPFAEIESAPPGYGYACGEVDVGAVVGSPLSA
jgi:hypothetical protein